MLKQFIEQSRTVDAVRVMQEVSDRYGAIEQEIARLTKDAEEHMSTHSADELDFSLDNAITSARRT